MQIFKILLNPANLIVLGTFFGIIIYYVRKISFINSQLLGIIAFLKNFKRTDLVYRFKELDEGLSAAPFISNYWADFKNTLMFSESVSLKNEKNDLVFQNVS